MNTISNEINEKDFSEAAKNDFTSAALKTIALGGFTIGMLDGIFAFVYYGMIRGANYLKIFQSVAAGLLGVDSAFNGGVQTFVLGLLLHFVVATGIAAVYFFASRIFPFLIRYAVPCGLIYGLIAYLVMNYVVIPLSAAGSSPSKFSLTNFLVAFIGHAFLVGLPAALVTRKFANK